MAADSDGSVALDRFADGSGVVEGGNQRVNLARTCYFAFFMAIFDGLRTSALWPEEESSNAWSAAAILTAIEGAALLASKQWYVMLGGEPFVLSRGDSFILFVILLGLNYLVLIRRRQWEEFRRSIRALPHRTQLRIKWPARVALVGVCVWCAYTFHAFWNWTPDHVTGR